MWWFNNCQKLDPNSCTLFTRVTFHSVTPTIINNSISYLLRKTSSTISAGFIDRTKQSETFQTIKVNKRNFRVHPKYNRQTQTHDIALVLLPVDLDFNEHIQPVQLLTMMDVGELFVGQRVDVMGWGRSSDKGNYSYTLLYTSVLIESNTICNKIAPKFDSTKICLRTKGHDSCKGDSGGPLVLTGTFKQIALVSFGNSICEIGAPSGNTKISVHKMFIEKVTGLKFN